MKASHWTDIEGALPLRVRIRERLERVYSRILANPRMAKILLAAIGIYFGLGVLRCLTLALSQGAMWGWHYTPWMDWWWAWLFKLFHS